MSRWRTCASQRFTPGLVTTVQSSPFSTTALPSPGSVNDVVQGRLLPSLKLSLRIRFLPDSGGGLTPGEPLTGLSFQPEGLAPDDEPADSGAPPLLVAGAGVRQASGSAAASGRSTMPETRDTRRASLVIFMSGVRVAVALVKIVPTIRRR